MSLQPPRRPFLLRKHYRRARTLAQAKREWRARPWRIVWPSPSPDTFAFYLQRAGADFDAHYLGTAMVRFS